ncbi:hypothetical protein ACX80R_05890 [Paeniglutamicibacter antarcticus]
MSLTPTGTIAAPGVRVDGFHVSGGQAGPRCPAHQDVDGFGRAGLLHGGGDVVVVDRGVPNKWTRRLGIGKQTVPDQAIDPRSVFKRRDFFPK